MTHEKGEILPVVKIDREENITNYKSASEAARANGCSPMKVWSQCNGKPYKSRDEDFAFAYADDIEGIDRAKEKLGMGIQDIRYIKLHLQEEDRLLQLGEECAELCKAALKLMRILRGKNPTPVSEKDVRENLLEEKEDVEMCLLILGLSVYDKLSDMQIWKFKRWRERIEKGIKGDNV